MYRFSCTLESISWNNQANKEGPLHKNAKSHMVVIKLLSEDNFIRQFWPFPTQAKSIRLVNSFNRTTDNLWTHERDSLRMSGQIYAVSGKICESEMSDRNELNTPQTTSYMTKANILFSGHLILQIFSCTSITSGLTRCADCTSYPIILVAMDMISRQCCNIKTLENKRKATLIHNLNDIKVCMTLVSP